MLCPYKYLHCVPIYEPNIGGFPDQSTGGFFSSYRSPGGHFRQSCVWLTGYRPC
jgi:hypothetical protein